MLLNYNPQQMAYLALVYLLFVSTAFVHALPIRIRQNQTTTLQTVYTSDTVAGPVTQTCVITLSPTTDENGNPAVEEVKKCSLSGSNSGNENGSGTSFSSATSFTFTTTAASTSSNTDGTFSTFSTFSTAMSPSNIQTSTAATATSTGTSGFSDTVTGTSGSSALTAATSSTTSVPPASGIQVNGLSTVSSIPTLTSSNTVSAAADATTSPTAATAAAAEQPSDSSTAFQLPGKKLSVLPIGLGVFAGISVIALIVVGLVTYERTKYRKAFRQRKLAESGAVMGYGGMAQRP